MRFFYTLVTCLTTLVEANNWLQHHSFSEPLNLSLRNDWLMGGRAWPVPNGLNLTNDNSNQSGWIASRHPLLTDTFQVTMVVSVAANAPLNNDEITGDPGMMLMFHDKEGKQWPPLDGDFYGMYPSIDGSAVFFALTSRENQISPSISFGEKPITRVKTPLPRGIYWNYLDKTEFELLLDIQGGNEIHGYIRSKSSDRWTQAFSESLPKGSGVSKNSHIILSATNNELPVRYSISRFSVSSQDEAQPGYHKDDVTVPVIVSEDQGAEHEYNGTDVTKALVKLTELFAAEFSKSHHFFDEQRQYNKMMMNLLDTIKGVHSEAIGDGSNNNLDEHITQITAKMENMQRSLASQQRPDRRINDSISRVESLFDSLSRRDATHQSSKNLQMYLMVGAMGVIVAGMAYVIMHMKKLEKKHIL